MKPLHTESIHREIQGEWRWTQQQGVYIWEILESIDIVEYSIHTVTFQALGLTHSCQAFTDSFNLCCSPGPGSPAYSQTLLLRS
jgi:hypothetical protein